MPSKPRRRKKYRRSPEASRDRALRKKLLKENETWTPAMKRALFEFQKVCAICGKGPPKVKLEVDHVRPLSRGFPLRPGNATLACRSDNARKSDLDITALDEATMWKLMEAAVGFRRYWESLQEEQG